MKFKPTLILLGVFILLLLVVYFLEFSGQGEDSSEDKLVSLASDDVVKIIFDNGEETIQFQKEGEDWLIVEPVEAKGDKYEVDRLSDDFSDLRFERIVEDVPSDLEKYGIPQKEIALFYDGQDQPVKILIGMENPLDNTFFAKKADETKVVLIPSSLKSLLEKKVFDFRQKDIFKFESDQAKSVKLRAKDIEWEAEKVNEEWFLRKPVNALAEKSKVNDVLNAISNLKAAAFVSEEKNDEEVQRWGLDNPDYEVSIDFPVENRQVTYLLHKEEDSVHATSSISPKILRVDDAVLADLEKEPADLRDKSVADFFSWEAKKLQVRKGDFSLTLTKDEEDNWQSNMPEIQEIDKEKVQSFLRKMESLEAEEFIDPPLKLADYGLDIPRAEVRIWAGDEESPTEVIIQIGAEEEESEKAFVKNGRFDYVFMVDSSFIEDLPGKAEDWKLAPEEEKKEETESR
jgi:hypothetical protein